MPNWCHNSATFICPTKEIYDDLLESINKNTWFQKFAPLGLDETKYEDGYEYKRAIEVWKTKWVPNDIEVVDKCDDTHRIDLSFDTAWSPPIGVYSKMYSDFQIDINAFYEELGCEYFGRCFFSKEGEFDETFDIPSNEEELEELRKVIGSELNQFMESTWEYLEERWAEEDEEYNDVEN